MELLVLGPTSALKSSQERYNKVINILRDREKTTFYLVARADRASLKEASRTSSELGELGLQQHRLFVNGIFKATNSGDEFAMKMESLAQAQLKQIPENLKNLPLQSFTLLPDNVLGDRKTTLNVRCDPARKNRFEFTKGHKKVGL